MKLIAVFPRECLKNDVSHISDDYFLDIFDMLIKNHVEL